MIKRLDIKDTFRNKRFILFTLIFPLAWYIMIVNVSRSAGILNEQNAYLWVTIASIIGIAGNSIVTFSKKISDTHQFYRLQAQTSHYSMRRWLMDQVVVQMVLNLSICLVILLSGLVMHAITPAVNWLILVALLVVMGLYLSVIGFLIGIFVDGKTIAALSMPLSMGFGVLMIRWDSMTSSTSTIINMLSGVQKFFPGYYLFDIVQKMIQNKQLGLSLSKYLLSCLLIFLPLIGISGWQFWKNRVKQIDEDIKL